MATPAVQVRQVTWTDSDFIERVTQTLLPQRPLMEFNAWQTWRKGNRPKKATDGVATTTRQEAELWKSVSAHYYGEDWTAFLAVQNAGADEEEDEPQARDARSSQGPLAAAGTVPPSEVPQGIAGNVERGMLTPERENL